MNIHEQLEHFLADLGVEMEYRHPDANADDDSSLPEVSIFQSSRDHYGVFYRLDIINARPELRVMVPIDQGKAKMEMYRVQLCSSMSLAGMFSDLAGYIGSAAFEKGREAAKQHLLYALAEVMKQLFWAGDIDELRFPHEIEVERLM